MSPPTRLSLDSRVRGNDGRGIDSPVFDESLSQRLASHFAAARAMRHSRSAADLLSFCHIGELE
jgi:hypothetical protein